MSHKQTPEEKARAEQTKQKILQRSTLISLVGVLLFSALGYLLYKMTPPPNKEILENVILTTEPKVAMAVVQKNDDGAWEDLDHAPGAGEKVAFRISSTHPIHVALFAEANHENKHLIFDYIRIPPGENRLLKVNNSPYTYVVKEGDEHVVFCMVVATDPKKLPQALAPRLSELHLDHFPPEHCARW